MRFEKYERPDLEELELELEGSFLADSTDTGNEVGGDIGDEPNKGPFD